MIFRCLSRKKRDTEIRSDSLRKATTVSSSPLSSLHFVCDSFAVCDKRKGQIMKKIHVWQEERKILLTFLSNAPFSYTSQASCSFILIFNLFSFLSLYIFLLHSLVYSFKLFSCLFLSFWPNDESGVIFFSWNRSSWLLCVATFNKEGVEGDLIRLNPSMHDRSCWKKRRRKKTGKKESSESNFSSTSIPGSLMSKRTTIKSTNNVSFISDGLLRQSCEAPFILLSVNEDVPEAGLEVRGL